MSEPAHTMPPLPATSACTGADHSAELLVHLSRLVYGCSSDASLTPTQWTALRYFATANRFSRTPSAFSEFNATTRGTASQTVKSLIAMGLLAKRAHETDKRSFLIELTDAGRAKLKRDPMDDLSVAIAALPANRQAMLADILGELVETMARKREAPTFGHCGDCGHCDTSRPGEVFCRCTSMMLTDAETSTLCIDFASALAKR